MQGVFQKVLDTWDSAPGPGWEERAASPGLTLSPSCLGEKEELPADLSTLAAPHGGLCSPEGLRWAHTVLPPMPVALS